MIDDVINTKIAELQQRVQALTDENIQLRRERDWARAVVTKVLPVATEEEERAFINEIQTVGQGGQLATLIAELEAENG